MGFLDRAIKRGVNRAVGSAVESAAERTASQAVNKAFGSQSQQYQSQGQYSDAQQGGYTQQYAQQSAQTSAAAGQIAAAFSGLAGSVTSYANEAAKNMKICSACGEAATAENKFCPHCGAKLPEQTLAQGAVCTACGAQNSVGTKFCAACGAKLPSAIAEEQAEADKMNAVMAKWDRLLPQYPKWSCGGTNFELDEENNSDGVYYLFTASFGSGMSGEPAVGQYRQLLMQSGFRQAGQYPDPCHLYNRINGVCFHVDTEHCFDGGTDHLLIYFNVQEPTGGYDYVKPAPKEKTSFKSLFKF